MKEFEFFIKKGNVKKQSPDKNLSKANPKDKKPITILKCKIYTTK